MTLKRIVLGTVTLVVGLPLAAMLVVFLSITVLDRTSGSIVSSGIEREYLLYVPDTYDPTKPTPLVISLHGGGAWPAQQKNLSRWNRLADQDRFIVVYPSGTPQIFGIVRIWHTFKHGTAVERDARFIADLIDTLQTQYNIDPAQIYANGMSNGGGMSFVLSCTLSHRIAAVGLVATAQSLPSDWCHDARPVPVMAFHGDADDMVPYEGGPLGDPFNPVKPIFDPVREWVARWAMRNRCAASPFDVRIAVDVVRMEYPECADGAEVVLFILLGGGHTWPGGKPLPKWWVGATNTSIDATRAMWEFFVAHPLQM